MSAPATSNSSLIIEPDKFRTMARLVLTRHWRGGAIVHRAIRSRWLSTAILTIFLALTSLPASAFDLVSADPAVDATVTTAPSAITLTFTSEVTDTGSSLSVRAPSGMAVDDGSLLIDGASALIGLKKLNEGGRYTVTYQFMSVEGEILNGTYSFTYDAPADISTPTATPTVSASPEQSAESPAVATGKSSRATDIFMIALLVTSCVVLIVIGRSLRRGNGSRKSKSKKRKKK